MQSYVAQDILKMLNCGDLANAQQVTAVWREVIKNGRLWQKIFRRNVRFLHYLYTFISFPI